MWLGLLTDGDALNSSLQKMKLKNRDERIVGYEEKVVVGGDSHRIPDCNDFF